MAKKIQPVHSEGDQPWDFFGRYDAKAETPVLWPPHAKSWLIGKDPDAGRDWGQEEKGMTEDEMAGWHHWLDAHEFGWTPGVGDGRGGLACCGSWGRKESDMTERLNWTTKQQKTKYKVTMNDQDPEKSLFNNVEIRWVEKGGSCLSLLNSSAKVIYWKWLEPKHSFQSPGISLGEKNWITLGDYSHLNLLYYVLCFSVFCSSFLTILLPVCSLTAWFSLPVFSDMLER